MSKKQMMALAVAAIFTLTLAGEALAARGGRGGITGRGAGTSTTTVRPAGSQRRDGTFLSTGTTANGSTTRPSRGNGTQDGSRLTGAATLPLPTNR